jgi:hypothetical protein
MSVLSEQHRIERLISLPRSSIFVLHQMKTGWRKTSCVGSLSRDGCLMSDHFIMPLQSMIVTSSLGGVFGGIRFPREWRYLLSWPL